MNHHVQPISQGKLKGYPIYVETTKEPFDVDKEKQRFLGLMHKSKRDED